MEFVVPIIIVFVVGMFIVFSVTLKKKPTKHADDSEEIEEVFPAETLPEKARTKNKPMTPTPHRTMKPRVSLTVEDSAEREKRRRERTDKVVVAHGAHHEELCAVEHREKQRYREERAIVADSLNAQPSEGCETHYFSRFVKLDEESEAQENERREEVIRAIVLGEVLNKPAYRRRPGERF